MKKTVVLQLKEALELLKDYPGIESMLDIDEAGDFLGQLEKGGLLTGISNFNEVDREKIDTIAALGKSSREEWVEALRGLSDEIIVFDMEENFEEEDCLISSCFPLDFIEAGTPDIRNGQAVFYPGNRAEFNATKKSDDLFVGTWAEVFFKIAEYVKKNLTYPDVPEVAEDNK